MSSSSSPLAFRPYSQCDCRASRACGNPPLIRPTGEYYQPPHHKAFAHWDGHLAQLDLAPRRHRTYNPPAPYVSSTLHRPCHDNMNGLQTCMSASGGSMCGF